MARWYGYTFAQTRALLLTEWWMLDGFLERHPPVDILMAIKMNWKPAAGDSKVSKKQARKANSEALAALPPRKKVRSVSEMPAFLRTPTVLKTIDEMRAEWQTNLE